MNALDQGLNISQVAQNFINSPEFSATYGSLNDTQFVTQLYANVLHRAPDDGGLAYPRATSQPAPTPAPTCWWVSASRPRTRRR